MLEFHNLKNLFEKRLHYFFDGTIKLKYHCGDFLRFNCLRRPVCIFMTRFNLIFPPLPGPLKNPLDLRRRLVGSSETTTVMRN